MSAAKGYNAPKDWHEILKQMNEKKKTENKALGRGPVFRGQQYNRVPNCVPYEFNAISIQVEQEKRDINASKISFDQVDRKFILTETPAPLNIGDFWAMVAEQKCKVIVMLGDFDNDKCKSYLPSLGPAGAHYGGIKVCAKKDNNKDLKNSRVNVIDVTVTYPVANEIYKTLSIVHYQLPELKTEKKSTIDDFMKFLKFMRPALAATAGKECSTLIHCPSGCKDSATFLLIDACVTDIVNQKSYIHHRLENRLLELLLQRDLPPMTGKDLEFANAVITKYVQKVKSANWKEELMKLK